jgi:glycerophosphoryl diester phosphodiesterase
MPAQCVAPCSETISPASTQCCSNDITLEELKSLKGKMDAADTTADAHMNTTAKWRANLYTAKGTLMTHAKCIAPLKSLFAKMTPELKSLSMEIPFEGD